MKFISHFCCPILSLLLIAIALFGCNTVPYTGRPQIMLLEQQDEIKFGQRAWNQLKEKQPESANRSYREALTRVGKNVADASKLKHCTWEFVVFDTAEPEAFCLPGGKVGISSGMFKYLQNDAELAAVLTHAIAHTAARHGGERISDLIMSQEDGGNFYQTNMNSNQNLYRAFGAFAPVSKHIRFTDIQEAEADYIGMIFLAEAGYSPAAAIKFRERMEKVANDNYSVQFFATHHYRGLRVGKIKGNIGKFSDIYSLANVQRGTGQSYGNAISSSSPADIPVQPESSDLLEAAHQALLKKDTDAFKIALAKAEFSALRNPQNKAAWMCYGKILSMVNNSMQTNLKMEGAFTRSLELDPNDYEARRYLADAYYKQELFDAAIKQLETVTGAGQYIDPKTIALLNMCYIRDGQYQRGISYLSKLADKYPDKDDIRLQLAVLARHSGNSYLAMSELRKVVGRAGAPPEVKRTAGKLMYLNRGRR